MTQRYIISEKKLEVLFFRIIHFSIKMQYYLVNFPSQIDEFVNDDLDNTNLQHACTKEMFELNILNHNTDERHDGKNTSNELKSSRLADDVCALENEDGMKQENHE